MAQIPELKEKNMLQQGRGGLRLFWAVHVRDIGLVVDTFETFPALKGVTRVFVSGTGATKKGSRAAADEKKKMDQVKGMVDGVGGLVIERRLGKDDLLAEDLGLREVEKWYLCAGGPLRKQVVGWMEGKNVVYEDFDY